MSKETEPRTAVVTEAPGNELSKNWFRSAEPVLSPGEHARWIVFADDAGLGDQVAFQLTGAQKSVVKVTAGNRYRRIARDTYMIRPEVQDDYRRIMRIVLRKYGAPSRVVHLWSMQKPAGTRVDQEFERRIFSIRCFLQELQRQNVMDVDVAVISNFLQIEVESATTEFRDSAVRFSRAMSAEFPAARCRRIDVDTTELSLAQIAVQVIREHSTPFADPVVAYRGTERWVLGSPDAQGEQTGKTANEVEGLLVNWWRELLATDRVSEDDDFFDLGGDSITAVQLFTKIKNAFGVDLGLSTIFEARTIRKLAGLIAQTRTSVEPRHAPRCLVSIQPKGKHPPIHIISGLGGNVIKFQKLAFYLGEDQPVFGLLPRGLDGAEPYFTRIEDMAAYYADAVQESQPHGPYRLMGYSFGGLVAFEVARQIAARGGEVSFLGVLDTAEPQYLDRLQKELPPWQRYRGYKNYLADVVTREGGFKRFKDHVLAKISSVTFRLYRALGRPVPRDLGKIEYINLLAGTQYRPSPYSGKLTVFRSSDREASEGTDRALGWGGLATQIEIVDLPSNHFNILQEPNVQLLADRLKTALAGQFGTEVHVEAARL